MTEKRFYYNTFYHADDMSRVLEYEIIDRQSYPNYPNHDEKEDIPNWFIYIGENDSGWQDMLVDLLNELNDEKEKLKEDKYAYLGEITLYKGEANKRKKENEVIKEEYKHHLSELQGENEILTKENEKLKDNLKEIGYEFKKYSYEETGKKIEDYNTEKLLTSLLQDIINELQNGWFVAEFESDFSNEVDINTLKTYAKNFCMKVSLRRTKPRKLFF